jgi:predicted nucleic acid-binding protein
VALLLDTGVVYAYYDRSDDWHSRAVEVLGRERRGLVLPAPVIPEVDHLLGRRLGAAARRVFYRGLAEGSYYVVELPRDGYGRVAEIDLQFADLGLGFVDSAVVVIAESLGLRRLATTDRRRFEPLAAAFALDLVV